jgi:hypothetical protein
MTRFSISVEDEIVEGLDQIRRSYPGKLPAQNDIVRELLLEIIRLRLGKPHTHPQAP